MNNDWWLLEAGEYVLGTLRGPERDLFEKLLARDSEAQALVSFWEAHFSALDHALLKQTSAESIAAVPPEVWARIEQQINQDQDIVATNDSERDVPMAVRERLEDNKKKADVAVTDERKLWRWRSLAAASLAASFVMGAFLVHQTHFKSPDLSIANQAAIPTDSFNILAILSDEDGAQLWAIVANETTGKIRAIALETPAESTTQSHQLWVVLPDDGGVESIGLLPYKNGQSRTFSLSTESSIEKLKIGSAFAISVEPPGGTDSPAPTGPVISAQPYTRVEDDSI